MIKISKGNYSLARKIVLESTCPSFSSILAGIAYGDIWINDLENPTMALVYSNPVGGYQILGELENDADYDVFFRFLEEELFKQLKAGGTTEFEFSTDILKVEKLLLSYFSKYKIIADQELAYIKQPEDNSRLLDNQGEYKFLEIDEECIAHNFINKDFMLEHITDSWGSIEAYLKYGRGFIAGDGDKIIGIILGTANYDNILPIDIETLSDYRKKGIATELTKLFLNYCNENQMTAYWNCITSNISSQNIAKRTGFQYIGSNNYYYFDFM